MSSKKASSTQNNTLTTTIAKINQNHNNNSQSNAAVSGASASASVTAAGAASGGIVNSPRNKYFQMRHQPHSTSKIFNMPKRQLIDLDTWTGSVSSITNDNAAFAQMYSDRWGIYNNQTYNIGYNDGNFTNVPTFNFDPSSSSNTNLQGSGPGGGFSPRSPADMQMDTGVMSGGSTNPLNLSPHHFHHGGQHATNLTSPQHSGGLNHTIATTTPSNTQQQSIDLNSFSMNHSPVHSPFQQQQHPNNSPIHQQHFQQQQQQQPQQQHHSQHSKQQQQHQNHQQQQQSPFQIQNQKHIQQQQQQMNSMDITDIGILPLDVVDYVMELEDEKLSPNPQNQQPQYQHPQHRQPQHQQHLHSQQQQQQQRQQQNTSKTTTKQQAQNIHNFHITNQEVTTTFPYIAKDNNNSDNGGTQNNSHINMQSPFQNHRRDSSSLTKIEPPVTNIDNNSTSASRDSNAELEFYRNFYNNNCNKHQQQQHQQQQRQNSFTSALLCDNNQEDEAMMDIADINDFNIPSIRPTDGWAFDILHNNGGGVVMGESAAEKCSSELVQPSARPAEAANVNVNFINDTRNGIVAGSVGVDVGVVKNVKILNNTIDGISEKSPTTLATTTAATVKTETSAAAVEVEEIPKEIFDKNGDTYVALY